MGHRHEEIYDFFDEMGLPGDCLKLVYEKGGGVGAVAQEQGIGLEESFGDGA